MLVLVGAKVMVKVMRMVRMMIGVRGAVEWVDVCLGEEKVGKEEHGSGEML